MLGFVHHTAQETIKKFILEGLTREQAIEKWERIMRAKLPERIKEDV